MLGEVGSRLVADVLAGATNEITLRGIIKYVGN